MCPLLFYVCNCCRAARNVRMRLDTCGLCLHRVWLGRRSLLPRWCCSSLPLSSNIRHYRTSSRPCPRAPPHRQLYHTLYHRCTLFASGFAPRRAISVGSSLLAVCTATWCAPAGSRIRPGTITGAGSAGCTRSTTGSGSSAAGADCRPAGRAAAGRAAAHHPRRGVPCATPARLPARLALHQARTAACGVL